MTVAPSRPAELSETAEQRWEPVCRLDQLTPERGAAVLLGGRQIALFLVPGTEDGPGAGGDDRVYAVDHHCPFSDANVIARGIVGSRGDATTVASPIYKQVFDLASGACLTEPGSLTTWPTAVRDGMVLVGTADPDSRTARGSTPA